jgi:hypothetical protein
MTDDVPGPELENRVAVFLDATDHVWAWPKLHRAHP